jgi:glutaredoxin
LRDDTPDLLLTWVDDKGDFHVVTKVDEVPEEAREQVRVVVTTREDGVGRLVYVADLRSKRPDGSYAVKTLTRAQWNDIGADRRKVRMEAVSRSEPAEQPTGGNDGDEISEDEKRLNARVRAIVYGADWCKPCHDAEDYLRELGVDVTKKDIEESRAARAEMNEKLSEAGRMGASIPVLDVGGKILIGFSRPTVKQAVIAARKPETL